LHLLQRDQIVGGLVGRIYQHDLFRRQIGLTQRVIDRGEQRLANCRPLHIDLLHAHARQLRLQEFKPKRYLTRGDLLTAQHQSMYVGRQSIDCHMGHDERDDYIRQSPQL